MHYQISIVWWTFYIIQSLVSVLVFYYTKKSLENSTTISRLPIKWYQYYMLYLSGSFEIIEIFKDCYYFLAKPHLNGYTVGLLLASILISIVYSLWFIYERARRHNHSFFKEF